MKLTNAQISALAFQIIDEIKQPAKEYNKKLEASKEYIDFYKNDADCQVLLNMQNIYGLDDYSIKRFLSTIREATFKLQRVSVPEVSLEKVERLITLLTIDESDLSNLTIKVKKMLTTP